MAYIQAYSLLPDPEYINIVFICLHAIYLNKILFKPRSTLPGENKKIILFFELSPFCKFCHRKLDIKLWHIPKPVSKLR